MIKKYLIIILLLFLCGCGKENFEKFYLSDKYYNNGEYISIKSDSISKNDNFVLFTYNNYCSLSIPCEDIFEEFMEKYKIDFLSIPFDDFKNTYLYKSVKYGPSIIIVKKGKVVAYLDANKDSDTIKYQDVDKFKEWISNYIYLERD